MVTDKKKKEVKQQLSEMQKGARKDLEEFGTIHTFEMKSECKDKSGEKTKVLIMDTDREGILGLFMQVGQPFEFTKDGSIKEDSDKIMKYVSFMSNVDMTKDEILKCIGWEALPKAREVARNFFMLRLVSDLNVE